MVIKLSLAILISLILLSPLTVLARDLETQENIDTEKTYFFRIITNVVFLLLVFGPIILIFLTFLYFLKGAGKLNLWELIIYIIIFMLILYGVAYFTCRKDGYFYCSWVMEKYQQFEQIINDIFSKI